MFIYRNKLALLLAISVCCHWLLPGEVCVAQVGQYQPSRPTVSPYLNLGRFNTGALPNYYSLVRPQIQQRDFNQQAQALNRAQQTQLLQLRNEVQRGLVPAGATGSASWFMIPAQQSTYLDTSAYYPEPTTGRRR